jgi:hypothetical protein
MNYMLWIQVARIAFKEKKALQERRVRIPPGGAHLHLLESRCRRHATFVDARGVSNEPAGGAPLTERSLVDHGFVVVFVIFVFVNVVIFVNVVSVIVIVVFVNVVSVIVVFARWGAMRIIVVDVGAARRHGFGHGARKDSRNLFVSMVRKKRRVRYHNLWEHEP